MLNTIEKPYGRYSLTSNQVAGLSGETSSLPDAEEDAIKEKNTPLNESWVTSHIYKHVGETFIEDGRDTDDGRYLVKKNIGEGGMGVVFEVYDRKLKRDAVIKFLNQARFLNNEEMLQLKKEVDVMGNLVHPGIIKVYDFVTTWFGPAIVMDKEDSPTIEKKIKDGYVFSPGEIKKHIRHFVQILKFLHSKHIRHGDIKPSNIFLNPVFIRLGDFGLAYEFGKHPRGEFNGSPWYSAPEYMRGEVLQSSDDIQLEIVGNIFILGIIIYEMITGKHVFDNDEDESKKEGIEEILQALEKMKDFKFDIDHHPAIEKYASKRNLDVKKMSKFFQKTLASEKEERYQDFEEFLNGLGDAFTEKRTESVPERVGKAFSEVWQLVAASIA